MLLCFDILFIVMEVLHEVGSTGDLSSISQTCRTLQRVAPRVLLDHLVSLRNDRHVVSFCLYMAADEGRRYPLLRQGLRLETGRLSKLAAFSLVGLLSMELNFSRLVITHGDEILSSDPSLPIAFALLSCIQHLEFSVSHCGFSYAECLLMFKHMQSRLITASLNLPYPTAQYAAHVRTALSCVEQPHHPSPKFHCYSHIAHRDRA